MASGPCTTANAHGALFLTVNLKPKNSEFFIVSLMLATIPRVPVPAPTSTNSAQQVYGDVGQLCHMVITESSIRLQVG